MSLKHRVKSLSEVPAELHGHYAEDNGEFVLAVDGMVSRDKLNEFRENNVTLKKQLEEKEAKYANIDPDVYRELTERAQKERDRKLIDAGKVNDLLEERTAAMRAEHEKAINGLSEQNTTLTKQLEGLLIDTAIRDAAAKAGVRATAVEDVIYRGRNTFRLADGKAIPMDGDKPIYGKNGDPMSVSEWVDNLTGKAPHLFEASQGSGANRAEGASAGGAGRISRGDSKSFLNNLDNIAAGKAVVTS